MKKRRAPSMIGRGHHSTKQARTDQAMHRIMQRALAREATGDFYCEGEQIRSALKCQRPCGECMTEHSRSKTHDA